MPSAVEALAKPLLIGNVQRRQFRTRNACHARFVHQTHKPSFSNRSIRRRCATSSRWSRRSGAGTDTRCNTCSALPRSAADRRLRQDGNRQGAGPKFRRRGLHGQAARLSRLCRVRAAAEHRGDRGPRRRGGYGAFWGEVQSNIHKALGCLGVITNGSIRDIPHDGAGLPDARRLARAVARLRRMSRTSACR